MAGLEASERSVKERSKNPRNAGVGFKLYVCMPSIEVFKKQSIFITPPILLFPAIDTPAHAATERRNMFAVASKTMQLCLVGLSCLRFFHRLL